MGMLTSVGPGTEADPPEVTQLALEGVAFYNWLKCLEYPVLPPPNI